MKIATQRELFAYSKSRPTNKSIYKSSTIILYMYPQMHINIHQLHIKEYK